ncbi:hypothetical protein N008_00070 [Hymenobacter sp. APR13]|nr:hypothetical protein N008_00070 [Hymenobacter sp. APR13]
MKVFYHCFNLLLMIVVFVFLNNLWNIGVRV